MYLIFLSRNTLRVLNYQTSGLPRFIGAACPFLSFGVSLPARCPFGGIRWLGRTQMNPSRALAAIGYTRYLW